MEYRMDPGTVRNTCISGYKLQPPITTAQKMKWRGPGRPESTSPEGPEGISQLQLPGSLPVPPTLYMYPALPYIPPV